jgi:MFS family permease
MFALAALYLLQALLHTRLREPGTELPRDPAEPRRSLAAMVSQPVFMVAVLGGTAGYGLMTLLMTATPISMHVNDGFTLQETASVIRAHVLAMYVPSLLSGFLVERFGVVKLMLAGVLLFALASCIALLGHELLHYWWALVLIGTGWNFLYVGGTTMLTYTYSLSDRFRAQAVNEFLVFGSSAVASLAAGLILHYWGWHRLAWVPLPVLAFIAVGLLLVRNDSLLLTRRTVGNA